MDHRCHDAEACSRADLRRAVAERSLLHVVAGMVAVALAPIGLISCSSQSPAPVSAPAPSGQSTPQPTGDVSPAGDIPDNQAFVAFTPADGAFTIKVPEGWARTDVAEGVEFTDKLYTIALTSRPTTIAPTVASVNALELSSISLRTPGFRPGDVTQVNRAVLSNRTAGDDHAFGPDRRRQRRPVANRHRFIRVDSVSAAVEATTLYRFFRACDEETLALQSVSMAIEPGEFAALVGPSGSAKSTLLSCLAGLDEPDGGSVLGGRRMSHQPETSRARLRGDALGVLLQNRNLLQHLTVRQNIALVQRIIRRPRLHDEADSLLVSAETVQDFQLPIGDPVELRLVDDRTHRPKTVKFHFVGVVTEFPTAPKDSFLVANAGYVAQQTGLDAVGAYLVDTVDGDTGAVPRESATWSERRPSSPTLPPRGTRSARASPRSIWRGSPASSCPSPWYSPSGQAAWSSARIRRTAPRPCDPDGERCRPRHLRALIFGETAVLGVLGLGAGAVTGSVLAVMLVLVLSGVFDPPPGVFAWSYLVAVAGLSAGALVAVGAPR